MSFRFDQIEKSKYPLFILHMKVVNNNSIKQDHGKKKH